MIHGIPEGVFYRVLSEQGKQYALYIHHSKRKGGSYYFITPGKYSENIILSLPAGLYRAEWVNPANGKVISSKQIKTDGSSYRLTSPEYTIDIALSIKAI